MSEWKKVKLGDVLVKITKGTTPPRGKGFVDDGINYIKSDAIGYDGRIDDSLFVSIDEETHKKFKRSQLEKDDILFSMAGVFLGKNAIVKEEHLPANTNQALAIIRLNQDLAKPQFVSYYLRQPAVIENVNNMSGQSAQPNINFQEISSIEISLPNIEEQENVVEVLSSLDDKIDLLHRQNKTLEQMAETLFRQWFVEEAKEDWEKGKLGEFVNISYGKILPTKLLLDEGYPVFGGNGLIGFYEKFLYEEPQVLVSCRGEASGVVNISLEKSFVTNNSLILERTKRKEITFEFLKYYALSTDFKLYVTGSAQPQITITTLYKANFVLPDKNIINEFSIVVREMEKKRTINQQQIHTLEKVRDTLLSKLMNGEVRVNHVETHGRTSLRENNRASQREW